MAAIGTHSARLFHAHAPHLQPYDEPLLGVVTLENLGLVLDPFKRELRAMQLRPG